VGAGACIAAATLAALGPLRGAVSAAVLGPLTAVGLRTLQSRPPPRRADRSLALTLDLCAAALRAGRTPADAVAAAAPAADPPTAAALLRVAGLLRLGADPVRAWAVLATDGPLAALASTAARSATSGIRSAAAFERLAADIRADCTAAATARAQRAGVLAIAPLAACFLPAFVCLGVVPVIVGVAQSALGVLR
jgi:Flp pilus assembly protein TadB